MAAVALGYYDENTNTKAQKLFHETTEEKFDLHRRKYTVEECTYFETYKKNPTLTHMRIVRFLNFWWIKK